MVRLHEAPGFRQSHRAHPITASESQERSRDLTRNFRDAPVWMLDQELSIFLEQAGNSKPRGVCPCSSLQPLAMQVHGEVRHHHHWISGGKLLLSVLAIINLMAAYGLSKASIYRLLKAGHA